MSAAANNTNRLALALSWLYSARGIPCLYYGTEQNFNGNNDPANREDMFDGQYEQGPSLGDNFNMTQGSFLRVAFLNNLRRLYPSLRRGTHVNLWNNSSGPGLFAYARRLGSEEVFVVFNTAGGTQTLPARPTSYPAGTVLVNLFNTNETLTVTGATDGIPPVNVPGGGFKMFIAADRILPLDPVVIAQTPAHYSTNVVATAPLALTFSKSMNTSAAQAAFTVSPPVGGSFTWNAARTVMTFTPSPGFAGNTAIVVRVNTNAIDAESGNRFHAAFETLFHTAPASYTDSVPPAIWVHSPAHGSVVSNVLAIAGVATDNVAIAAVEVQIDGGDWAAATGAYAWTYTIDTRHFLNGTRQIAARARDSSGNLSAPALLDVRFVNIPGPYEARLAAGNFTAATNCDALVWTPDQPWRPGSFGWLSGTNGFIGSTISNLCAAAQPLFQRERYSTTASTLDYRFDLPEGRYEITLLQTETWVTGVNQRVFDLYIEGVRTLTNFDIFAVSGGMNLPLVQTFEVDVDDARLDLHFIPWADNARVSGIGVRRIGEVDTDHDGIPNWWMLAWFDHPTGQEFDQSLAHQDADGDGFTNLEEFIAQTSPLDPDDHPHIRDFVLDPLPRAFVPSSPNRRYDLQWKPDPIATSDWITVAADQPGTGALLPIIDTNAPPQGVYRILIRIP